MHNVIVFVTYLSCICIVSILWLVSSVHSALQSIFMSLLLGFCEFTIISIRELLHYAMLYNYVQHCTTL